MISRPRDEIEGVLASFAAEHPRPLADDVRKWSELHPKFADEILKLALDLNLIATMRDADPPRELTQAELDKAWELRLAASHNGKKQPGQRLGELVAAAGTDLANLATLINIDRRVLNSLEAGRVTLPISQRLVVTIADALRSDAGTVAAALTASYLDPKLGFAKASGQPIGGRISYANAIAGSEMTDAQKAYWVEQD